MKIFLNRLKAHSVCVEQDYLVTAAPRIKQTKFTAKEWKQLVNSYDKVATKTGDKIESLQKLIQYYQDMLNEIVDYSKILYSLSNCDDAITDAVLAAEYIADNVSSGKISTIN